MATTWKSLLASAIDDELEHEIDVFASQIQLCKTGKMNEKVFAESRLRRGVYGQRYDNGSRWDGETVRSLAYPCGDIVKGPHTVFDAPGMLRIKIPYGGLNPAQLECMAQLAEEYSDGILHITTRQDIQLHFVHIEDTPDLMYRLAAVGITTREACGNSVRNVTGCAIAGVCATEAFDTTPYTEAIYRFLLGHRDTQDFGRKFKIAVSGCKDSACALAMMHDAGLIAKIVDGQRGFELWVGGGLGSVPYQAQCLYEFVSEAEILPVLQAICRVFGRDGEKKLRSKARLKFLLNDRDFGIGLEEFRRRVEEARAQLPPDEAWTAYLADLRKAEEDAAFAAAELEDAEHGAAFAAWRATNVSDQNQAGYCLVKLAVPLGDLTSHQAYALADIARQFTGETTGIRLTADQNFVFRFVPAARLPALHARLHDLQLAEAGVDGITDITACPGTDTCKLGIAGSRPLAGVLRDHLLAKYAELDPLVRDMVIKVSGCFNSCGQHHIADIGFYGVTRKRNGRAVPHFQVFLGGERLGNARSFGLGCIAIPSKRIPQVVDRLTGHFVAHRQADESFNAFVARAGKKDLKELIRDLAEIPTPEEDPDLYQDWFDPRPYTTGDMGIGECAGEVVATVDFGLAEAERIVFDAQVALDERRPAEAARLADDSMFVAAKALIYTQFVDITDDRQQIIGEFSKRLLEPKIFWDQFAGDKFARYFFEAAADPLDGGDPPAVHRRIEEATLFIEACHSTNNKFGSV